MQYLTQELKDQGVESFRFYNLHTVIVSNICTVCLFIDKNGKALARGVSIRAIIDGVDKKIGRMISYGRAKKALFNQETSGEIIPETHDLKKNIIRKQKVRHGSEKEEFILNLKNCRIGKYKKIGNTKDKLIIQYYIPRNFCTVSTISLFTHKSYYKPELTKFEKEYKPRVKNIKRFKRKRIHNRNSFFWIY